MTITPLHDYVLVKPTPPESKTASGIVLPTQHTEDSEGVVVAWGARVTHDLKKGDTVLFTKYGLNEYEEGGTRYYLLPQANLYAIRR